MVLSVEASSEARQDEGKAMLEPSVDQRLGRDGVH
jgi:hypothetical protein